MQCCWMFFLGWTFIQKQFQESLNHMYHPEFGLSKWKFMEGDVFLLNFALEGISQKEIKHGKS